MNVLNNKLTIEKWVKWLNQIKLEATTLLSYRYMHKEVINLINQNKEIQIDSQYYSLMFKTYIAFITMGIRRQIKSQRQSISLKRLLSELIQQPKLITRDYYYQFFKEPDMEFIANNDFNKFCNEENDNYISVTIVQADLNCFLESAKIIETYTDRILAHTDKRGMNTFPETEDVDKCLDILDKLICKYYLLLNAKSHDTLLPTFQNHWQEIFEFPWIQNSQ